MPQVSVIIPTYNRGETLLADAVESVLDQSFDDFELIVVDDGSTDGTAELLKCWSERIHTIRTKRRGVASARNSGAAAACGRWLAFLDSDDRWLPEKLELQLAAHREHSEFRFSHTDEMWMREGRRVNPLKKHAKRGGRIFEYCLPMCRISPSAAMIDREFFLDLGGFDESFRVCEDYELWLRVTARVPVLYLDRPLVVKRGGHPDQLSASHWGFDRWRARAIRMIIDGGMLGGSQRRTALGELVHKCRILENGYEKRGKKLPALRWRKTAQTAEMEIEELEMRQPAG